MIIGGSPEFFAARKPNAPALICDDEFVTWRDFAAAVDALAILLNERVPPFGPVALALRNSPAMLALFLACARSGREAVVLDPSWPRARIGEVLRDLPPMPLFCETQDLASLADGAICMDSRAPLPVAEKKPAWPKADPKRSFYVGFTSGSTGRPKGYRRTHESWLTSFEGDRIEFGLTKNDVVLAPGSMTHSLFLYAAIHGIHVGATVLMARGFQPAGAVRMARKYGATVAYAAPTQWRLMLDTATETLPSLRWALSSGAKWFRGAEKDIAVRAPHARFAEFYGASELSFVAVRKSGEGCPEGSVGRAFANVAISIRDDDGVLVEPGDIGQIFVDSPYVFSGYALGSDDVARCGAELSVGDLGYLDEAGFLHLVGRRDRMIVTSGKNIYPEEIERALEAAPGVRAAAAFGVADPVRGQKIVALVLPQDDFALSRDDLLRRLREKLPVSFIPRQIVISKQWRWTNSGKTDFGALRSLWEAGAWDESP